MPQPSTPVFGTDPLQLAEILNKYKYQVKVQNILAGTSVGFEKRQVLLQLGLKKAGCLPVSEIFMHAKPKYHQILIKHWPSEYFVLSVHERKVLVSLRRLHYLVLWDRFKQIEFEHLLLYPSFQKTIKKARLYELDGLSLYVRNKHLPKYFRRKKERIGLIPVKILRLQLKKRKIFANAKLALVQKQRLSLFLGLVQEGVILSILPFGLFLNVHGMKSLLHISEISTQRITHLKNIYKVGQKLPVKILYINSRRGRIALSAKV